MFEKIKLTDDEGNELEVSVIEQTKINNTSYLLVTDSAAHGTCRNQIRKIPRRGQIYYEGKRKTYASADALCTDG